MLTFLAGRRTERVLDSDAENKSEEGREGAAVLVVIPGSDETSIAFLLQPHHPSDQLSFWEVVTDTRVRLTLSSAMGRLHNKRGKCDLYTKSPPGFL